MRRPGETFVVINGMKFLKEWEAGKPLREDRLERSLTLADVRALKNAQAVGMVAMGNDGTPTGEWDAGTRRGVFAVQCRNEKGELETINIPVRAEIDEWGKTRAQNDRELHHPGRILAYDGAARSALAILRPGDYLTLEFEVGMPQKIVGRESDGIVCDTAGIRVRRPGEKSMRFELFHVVRDESAPLFGIERKPPEEEPGM